MQPVAVMEVVWSSSIQHTLAKKFHIATIDSLGNMDRLSPEYAPALITAIYNKRMDYVSNLPPSQVSNSQKKNMLTKRYPNELKNALAMLEEF